MNGSNLVSGSWLALLGVALAAGAHRLPPVELSSQRVGLALRALSAGDRLAPVAGPASVRDNHAQEEVAGPVQRAFEAAHRPDHDDGSATCCHAVAGRAGRRFRWRRAAAAVDVVVATATIRRAQLARLDSLPQRRRSKVVASCSEAGSRALSVVPAPGLEVISIRPPVSATRSRIPDEAEASASLFGIEAGSIVGDGQLHGAVAAHQPDLHTLSLGGLYARR